MGFSQKIIIFALNMKKGKILVVDDNQGIRNALKILLAPHFSEIGVIASPKTLVDNRAEKDVS